MAYEQALSTRDILMPSCPASIWLLGGAANCGKGAGHDGPHEVTIKWEVS